MIRRGLGRVVGQVLGVGLVSAGLLMGIGLAAEAWLRWVQFGSEGVLRPTGFMAPRYRFTRHEACRATPGDHRPFAPSCSGLSMGIEIATNSGGLNDREVDESRPHYRVLLMGDSVSAAQGVPQRGAYHALLEERLDRELADPGFVEFYNHASPGKSTSDHVRDLEGALARAPLDAALVGVSATDFLEDVRRGRTCRPGDEAFGMTPEENALHRVRVAGRTAAFERLAWWEGETGLWTLRWLAERLRALQVTRYADDPTTRALMLRVEEKARGMYRSCASRMREIADGASLDLAWAVLAVRPTPAAAEISRILRALGEPVVDLTDTHRQFDGIEEMLVHPGDHHPNAAVHAVFAERLYAALDGFGWLDRIRDAHAPLRERGR